MHSILLKNNTTAWMYRGDKAWKPQNPWVVLVHGAGMHHGFWQFQTRSLACCGINVCAIDLPGHGIASTQLGMQTIEAYAAWLSEVLWALKAPPVTVVGHSMGACIAITLACQFADQVDSVVTIGGGIQVPVHGSLLEAAKNKPQTAASFMAAHSQGPNNALGSRTAPGVWLTGVAQAMFSHCSSETYHDDLAACAAWQGEIYASQVGQPALVVCGAKDRMIHPGQGKALASVLQQAQHETWSGVGHLPTFEASQRMRGLLADWISTRTTSKAMA